MSQKLSDELKQAVMDFIAAGNSRRAAAKEFKVSPSFVIKLAANRSIKSAAYTQPALALATELVTEDADFVSGDRLADLLGVSTRSVSEFAVRGIVRRDGRNRFHLKESIQGYCEHIRAIASGRGGEDAQALSVARARLATEQADTLEMRNAKERGELLPKGDVHLAVTEAFSRVRSKLLAIPSKLAPLLFSMSSVAETRDVITKAIHETLVELSGTIVVAPAPAAIEQSSGAGGGAGMVGGAGTASLIDRKPVGRSRKAPKPRS